MNKRNVSAAIKRVQKIGKTFYEGKGIDWSEARQAYSKLLKLYAESPEMRGSYNGFDHFLDCNNMVSFAELKAEA